MQPDDGVPPMPVNHSVPITTEAQTAHFACGHQSCWKVCGFPLAPVLLPLARADKSVGGGRGYGTGVGKG